MSGARPNPVDLDLDQVLAELDRLAYVRRVGGFTPADERHYDSLIARETELLEQLAIRPRRDVSKD